MYKDMRFSHMVAPFTTKWQIWGRFPFPWLLTIGSGDEGASRYGSGHVGCLRALRESFICRSTLGQIEFLRSFSGILKRRMGFSRIVNAMKPQSNIRYECIFILFSGILLRVRAYLYYLVVSLYGYDRCFLMCIVLWGDFPLFRLWRGTPPTQHRSTSSI